MKDGLGLVSAILLTGALADNAAAQWSWTPDKAQPHGIVAPAPQLNPVSREWGNPPTDGTDDADMRIGIQDITHTCTFSAKRDPDGALTQKDIEDYSRRIKRDFFVRLDAFMKYNHKELAWARLYCVNTMAAREIAEREEREERAIGKAERARERRREGDES